MGGKGRYGTECWAQSSSGGAAMETTQRVSRRMMVSAQIHWKKVPQFCGSEHSPSWVTTDKGVDMINSDLTSGVLHHISRCGTLSRSHSLVTIHSPRILLTCDWFLPPFQHFVILPISYDKLEKTSMYLCSSSWTVPVFSSFTSAVTTDKADTMLPF